MDESTKLEDAEGLAGRRVAFVGKLGGMNRREAKRWVRTQGGQAADEIDERVDLIVIGADELPLDEHDALMDPAVRDRIGRGECEVLTETQLWQQLGLVEPESSIRRLYTPAMLAQLLGVSVATIRTWHRRGLIAPAREVRRLPYFDFQEVATARRIASMIAAGASPGEIKRMIDQIAELVPGSERPLAQLSVLVEGREILLRQGGGLIEPGGQLRIDFDALEQAADAPPPTVAFPSQRVLESPADGRAALPTLNELLALAADLEDEGRLDDALETCRTLLMAYGPRAETSFQVAELLYRQGDLCGARERYYAAIELDEDYVEARANLGCVLAELGQPELAVAAFRGALRYHPDYPDVHFHLARTLDEQGEVEQARESWRRFLELAPESPWADEARGRVGLDETLPIP